MDDEAKALIQSMNEHQALKDILTAGGIGLAGGAGVAGLLGLPKFFGRPHPKSDPRALGPSVVAIPTPVYSTAADQLRAQRLKTATFAETRADLPYYYPGMTAAALAGIGGGSWLMNRFLKHKAESDLKAQEDAARSEYHNAMLEQYDPKLLPTADRVPVSENRRVIKQLNAAPDMPQLKLGSDQPVKLASDETLADLDKLADLYFEKNASVLGYDLPEVPSMNNLLGLYGAYAVPAAAIGGYATYQHFKDRSPETLVQRAIKERERERWARRPPEIYAVPQPVHVDRSGGMSEVAPKTAADNLNVPAVINPKLVGTALGLGTGALIGGLGSSKNRWRNALLGGSLGAGLGYAGGSAYQAVAGDPQHAAQRSMYDHAKKINADINNQYLRSVGYLDSDPNLENEEYVRALDNLDYNRNHELQKLKSQWNSGRDEIRSNSIDPTVLGAGAGILGVLGATGLTRAENPPKSEPEKKALLLPPATLLGALIGASQAPKNNRWRGAGRGAALGASTSLGASLGGATGYLAGNAVSPGAGGLLGLGGAAAGGLLAYHALKEPIWGRPWKPDLAAVQPTPAKGGKSNISKVPEKSAGVFDAVVKPVVSGVLGGGAKVVGRGAKSIASGVRSLAAPRAAPVPKAAPAPLPKPFADMSPGRITTGPAGASPSPFRDMDPGRISTKVLAPPPIVSPGSTGTIGEVARAAGAAVGSVANAAKSTARWVPKVVKNVVNDAQGGFSAADTARRAARVDPALNSFLGRQMGAAHNALASPYINPMNIPRGIGALADKGLGALGTAVGGTPGAAVGAVGKGISGLGKLTSYAANAAQAAPSSLITGSGRAAGLARGALYGGAMAPAAATGAYSLDRFGRRNLGLGLLDRDGRQVANSVAKMPINPLSAAGIHVPGFAGIPKAVVTGGSSVGADPSALADRDMPADIDPAEAALPTLFSSNSTL